VAVRCIFSTAEGSALTIQLYKDTSTGVPGGGSALLTNNANAGFDGNASPNTVQVGTLTGTTANLQLAAGDRLAVKCSGTPGTIKGVAIAIALKGI
jgi:hypothetical protein